MNEDVSDLLEGLHLQYLDVSECELSEDDVKFIFSMKDLVHLHMSLTDDLYLDSIDVEPNFKLQILSLSSCRIGFNPGTSYKSFFNFLKKMQGLKQLEIPNSRLTPSQFLKIIELKIQKLEAMNVLTNS